MVSQVCRGLCSCCGFRISPEYWLGFGPCCNFGAHDDMSPRVLQFVSVFFLGCRILFILISCGLEGTSWWGQGTAVKCRSNWMGPRFGTSNGTMDLIEMSRNVSNREVIHSCRTRNLVGKRVVRKIVKNMPRAARSTSILPAYGVPTEAGVARDLAKNPKVIGLRRVLWTRAPICHTRCAELARVSPAVAVGLTWV